VWWCAAFDGTLIASTVTGEAVAYYVARTDELRHHAQPGLRMKRASVRYRATVPTAQDAASGEVAVVTLELAWSQYCGSLCAMWFSVTRTVTFDADGTVIDDHTAPFTVSVS
jgi:hypothetical protein